MYGVQKGFIWYTRFPLQFLQLPSTHMYIHDRDVDIVEQFGVEFDRVAGGKEPLLLYHRFNVCLRQLRLINNTCVSLVQLCWWGKSKPACMIHFRGVR